MNFEFNQSEITNICRNKSWIWNEPNKIKKFFLLPNI